jgi:hypothetical protein
MAEMQQEEEEAENRPKRCYIQDHVPASRIGM